MMTYFYKEASLCLEVKKAIDGHSFEELLAILLHFCAVLLFLLLVAGVLLDVGKTDHLANVHVLADNPAESD